MKKFNMPDSATIPAWRKMRHLCCIALMFGVLCMAGCSSIRFTYNHGDTLLYWWLDAYVGIDSEQKIWLKNDIDNLFLWHRQTQLKEYQQLLVKGQHQLQGHLGSADLLADYSSIRNHTELLLYKAAPGLADLARSMHAQQISQMEKKFASSNDDFRKKFLRGDMETRQKNRYKKSMDQFETWFGNFSSHQEELIRLASYARPLDDEIWLEERILRQKNISALLQKVAREKPGKDATLALLNGLIKSSFERFDAPERKGFFDSHAESTAQMVLTVIKMTTPAQKIHAQKRMQGWIDDFGALEADVN